MPPNREFYRLCHFLELFRHRISGVFSPTLGVDKECCQFLLLVDSFFQFYLHLRQMFMGLLHFDSWLEQCKQSVDWFFHKFAQKQIVENLNVIRLAGSQAGGYSYISEFHTPKTAARAAAFVTIILNCLGMVSSVLGMLILPLNFNLSLGFVEFKPWRLFLIACSMCNLWNGIAFAILPESPKFLLSTNRKEEALQVLRRVYAFNTGKSPEVSWLNLFLYFE